MQWAAAYSHRVLASHLLPPVEMTALGPLSHVTLLLGNAAWPCLALPGLALFPVPVLGLPEVEGCAAEAREQVQRLSSRAASSTPLLCRCSHSRPARSLLASLDVRPSDELH